MSTGGVFPPNSKHFGDLFNEILPDPAQVLPRALELATEIAQNVSPTSQYLNRALLWRNPGTAEEAHLLESAVICHTFESEYVACPVPVRIHFTKEVFFFVLLTIEQRYERGCQGLL